MKFIPALFATVMVKSLLAKRKHMTRREIKKKYSNTDIVWREDKNGKRLVERQNDVPDPVTTVKEDGTTSTTHHLVGYREIKCPYGKPGDILYVREMHYRVGHWVKDGISKKGKQKWKFVADKVFTEVRYFDNPPPVIKKNTDRGFGWYKRNSLFMPKTACRIFLEITNIKVERLQDISEADAKAEGSEPLHTLEDDDKGDFFKGFKQLWQKINGAESWKANPYVWVISFKNIEQPESFLK